MRQYYYHFLMSAIILIGLSVLNRPAYAAQAIDLRHQPVSVLKTFSASTSIRPIDETVDFKQTQHIRLQQLYHGYVIHGGNAVLHMPSHNKIIHENNLTTILATAPSKATLNGIFYQGLDTDLRDAPAYIFNSAQAEKATQQVIHLYQQKTGIKNSVSAIKSDLIVYVDPANKAHWAYFIGFNVNPYHESPAKPLFIVDAMTLGIYQTWNNIQTLSDASAGGFGGNDKMGRFLYDGLGRNFSALTIKRDATNKICYLQNADVTVKDARDQNAIVKFACAEKSAEHNNLFWDASFDAVNGAYSPSNDALYIGKVVKNMYQTWYGIPVLQVKGKPMMLTMLVHENEENAAWDGEVMHFGDGGQLFYPLVSVGVGAHEISHGFTEQHSNLEYYGQSGGLNESFSDMAAQAAEYYSTGRSSWLIGAEIMRAKDDVLRYMDDPTKDCLPGDHPGDDCSIGDIKNYHDGLDVHYSSGLYNKVFYLMSTASGWNTKKAFDVMEHANVSYWTPTETFASAGCGIIAATKDYGYEVETVKKALSAVGMNPTLC